MFILWTMLHSRAPQKSDSKQDVLRPGNGLIFSHSAVIVFGFFLYTSLSLSGSSDHFTYKCMLCLFVFSVFHRTLTWIIGFLTCVRHHSYAGVGHTDNESAQHFLGGKLNDSYVYSWRSSNLWISSPRLLRTETPRHHVQPLRPPPSSRITASPPPRGGPSCFVLVFVLFFVSVLGILFLPFLIILTLIVCFNW